MWLKGKAGGDSVAETGQLSAILLILSSLCRRKDVSYPTLDSVGN